MDCFNVSVVQCAAFWIWLNCTFQFCRMQIVKVLSYRCIYIYIMWYWVALQLQGVVVSSVYDVFSSGVFGWPYFNCVFFVWLIPGFDVLLQATQELARLLIMHHRSIWDHVTACSAQIDVYRGNTSSKGIHYIQEVIYKKIISHWTVFEDTEIKKNIL